MRPPFPILLVAFAGAVQLLAQSNIDPAHAIAVSREIGGITFLPQESSGARINQFHAAGHLYGENVGWISLGSGTPANGVHYQNNSPGDFGVNVLLSGGLRGFAYGANIGWINFEETGNPRIDWATGKLHGAVYSANTGWIHLEGEDFYVAIDSLAPSPDSDGDGLPDAWEIQHAGDLAVLGAGGDADEDGQPDSDEYRAGTNPTDPSDLLALHLELSPDLAQTIEWPTQYGYIYRVEHRSSLNDDDSWTPAAETPLLGSGNFASLTLQPDSAQARFFRVAAYPPLSIVQ